MKKSKIQFGLLLIVALVFNSFVTFAQNPTVVDGEVMAVISLGQQDYSIIRQINNDAIFKTSPYNSGALAVSEILNMQELGNPNTVEIIKPSLNAPLLAHRMVNTGHGVLYPPSEKMPIEEKGILFFQSLEHLHEYQELVRIYLDESDAQTSVDDKLEKLEDEFLGFTSYRKYLINRYNLDGGLTELQIDEAEQADIVNDDVSKAIFNENRFIGIANKVYHYHAESLTLICDKADSEALAVLKDICQKRDDKLPCDIWNTQSEVMQLKKKKRISFECDFYFESNESGKGVTTWGPINEYYLQTIPTQRDALNCDYYTKYLAIELYYGQTSPTTYQVDYYQQYPNDLPTLTIDWGDGSPTQVIYNYNGGEISHTYPSGVATTYYPQTTITAQGISVYDGNNVPLGQDIEFTTSSTCTDLDKQQWGEKTSGSWKMKTKIWTVHNFWGHEIGSYTHAYKYQSGEWKKDKATIAAFVNGNYRHLDCSFKENKAGNNSNNNSKEVQKTKNKLWAHYSLIDGDVTSYHTLVKGGTSIALTMVLNPCQ